MDSAADQTRSDQDFLVKAPVLSMPKGGGAIRGVGEKFTANPATGSCGFSIPLPTAQGRAGFGPELSLSYDSASGNGPFGFGWSLDLPAITRKTDKGLPRYDDDFDTFLISGTEDLVPVLGPAGTIDDDLQFVPGYAIRRYRPRVEGGFARIERWRAADGDTHWRSISSDNVLSIYGKDGASRIFDPADPRRVFTWLICERRDDKGNAIIYDYRPEDGTGLNLTQAHEQQRGGASDRSRTANRYLDRVRYGNATTLLDPTTLRRPLFLDRTTIDGVRWMFEIVFDYGSSTAANPDVVGSWTARADPFSMYRPGFEVRTYRLCRRVLLFHDFPADPDVGSRCLVRSLDFSYRTSPFDGPSSDPGYTFLQAAAEWRHQRNGVWHRRSLPPLEFRYSEARIDDRVRDVGPQALENLPIGIGSGYQWVDLDGEGISGILTEQAGSWFYKCGLGEGPSGPEFGFLRTVSPRPAIAALNGGRQQFLDVQGDGVVDLVEFRPPLAGLHERDELSGWKAFRSFEHLPNIDWEDANLRFIDLTGDGQADALVTEHEVFTWYPSLGDKGFGVPERVATALDERHGPRIVFASADDAIYLADMSGDGLSDLVRVRNGETCYWPNLGYGRFGPQVVMDDSPWFDHPDQFDQQRIRLADIDGSGTTDLIYLGRGGARLWFNRSGNSWSVARDLPFPVATTHVGQVQVTDLMGNGTACLVWSSDLPGDSRRPLRYLDLMGGRKPHLMIEMRNNLGAVTTVDYAASTKFYLRDKAAGTPWVTKLPFPVHCVEKVTATDLIRKTVFSNTYSYHHGHFDAVEREFRGFGRVEQVDTERFDSVSHANSRSPFVAADHKLYQPPVKTVTWFHTGFATDRSRILGAYEQEYFPARYADRLPPTGFAEYELPQPEMQAGGSELDADEWREAMRACRGRTLRQEVIELEVAALQDRGEHKAVRIFSATEKNCHLRRVQPRGPNRHAVFLVMEGESITYHYELALGGAQTLDPDPRIAHTLNLRFDDYGRVLQAVSAVYPRGKQHSDNTLTPEQVDLVRAVQNDERHVSYVESSFAAELAPDIETHRIPAPCETSTYDLTGVDVPAGARYFTTNELRSYRLNPVLDTQATRSVGTLQYHQRPPDGAPRRRLVEHVVTLYFKDDLSGPLALAVPSRLGLVYETYKLALTRALVDAVFRGSAGQDDFAGEARTALARSGAAAGYLASGYQTTSAIFGTGAAEGWWQRSGVAGFSAVAPLHFYLPTRYTDSFGSEIALTYDTDDLFIQSSRDPLGNTSTVEAYDRRVLAPARMKDLNDNITETAFDIRGLAAATAVMGKVVGGVPETGDTVGSLPFDELNPAPDAVAQFFDTVPLDEALARAWLGKATTRFVYHFGERYTSSGAASWGVTAAGACGISRERHESDLPSTSANRIPTQIAFEYSDGAGAVFVKKLQAEADPALAVSAPRWLTNGKTVVNNKGKAVLQYEPYFSPSHGFAEPTAVGVSPVMFYDAPGRLVRTEHPDGTLSRVEFSPWFSRSFDQNDTVLESQWYRVRLTSTERGAGAAPGTAAEEAEAQAASPSAKRAARLAALHANTPSEEHFDSLGRSVVAIAWNRSPSDAPAFSGTPLAARPWVDERILTFTKLDAEGKTLLVCDARGNLVLQHIVPPKPDHTPLYDAASDYRPAYNMPATAVPGYDIAGNMIFQHGMDGGDRRMFLDGVGQAVLAWDYNERTSATTSTVFREHRRLETGYDELRRLTSRRLRIRDEATGNVNEFLTEDFRYGEGLAGDKARNLRGQLWQHYDGSGLVQTDAVDLSGGPLAVRRRVASEIQAPVLDWTGRALNNIHAMLAPGFEGEVFTQRTDYDALGRMTRQYNWHVESPRNSGVSPRVAVYLPQYGRRGTLEKETLLIRARKTPSGHQEVAGVTRTQQAITGITYNAKGQKLTLQLGNGTTTRFVYDDETFRLVHLFTRRGSAFTNDCGSGTAGDERPRRPCGVQNVHYHYDPVGNITHIQDDAQQTIWFANQQVEPSSDYIYDAVYRLIEADGRENSVAMGAPSHPEGPWPSGPFPSPGATSRYIERYRYDRTGNIEEIRHLAPANTPTEPPGWTRNYRYAVGSNQLVETWYGRTRNPALGQGNVTYAHDVHGSMLNLNGASRRFDLRWNWIDMLHTIDLGGGGRAWYQYGADKQRCRSRIDRNPAVNGTFREERLSFGGYERYRRHTGDPNDPVEEIESHHLFEGEQRVLLVDDVLKARDPRPDGLIVRTQTLWRYQYGNHLGAVSAELDQSARIVSYEEFHPYGTTAYRLLNTAVDAPPKLYRHSGLERDEESGLNYHGERYFVPWLGRWPTCDPALGAGGAPHEINSYTYASDNPLIVVDRDGRQSRMVAAVAEEIRGPFDWIESKVKEFKGWVEEDIEDAKNFFSAREPDLSPKPITPTAPPPLELKQFEARIPTHDEYYRSLEKPRQVRVMGGTLTVWEPLELQQARRDLKKMNDFVEATDTVGAMAVKGTAELIKAEAGARFMTAAGGALVKTTARGIALEGTANFAARQIERARLPTVAGTAPAVTPTAAQLVDYAEWVAWEQTQRLSSDLGSMYAEAYLKAGDVSAAFKHPRLGPANYGKLMEQMTASHLDPNYLQYIAAPNQADWAARGANEGLLFDLTTVKGRAEHFRRPYGENLIVITYPGMPTRFSFR